MEFGWVMLLVLAIMGGIIAYLGDKIGSRVGKRKSSCLACGRNIRLSSLRLLRASAFLPLP